GRVPAQATTRLASVDAPVPASRPRSLMDVFFGNKEQVQQPQQPQQPATVQLASLSEPTQRTVSTIEVAAPVPAPPLRAADGTVAAAAPMPFPAQKSSRLLLATRAALPPTSEDTALTALAAIEVPLPQPRVLMTDSGSNVVTAYAPEAGAGGGPQLDLRRIIEDGNPTLPAIAGTPD